MKSDKSNQFIKDTCKYFMDFLETDFHKRKLPKRHVNFRNARNLLLGFNTAKYPSFRQNLIKLISSNFDKDVMPKITKGKYKSVLPKELIDLVERLIKKLTQEQLDIIIQNTEKAISENSNKFKKDYDSGVEILQDYLATTIKKQFVSPFIESIKESILRKELADDNEIFLIEDELTGVLISELKEVVSLLVRKTIAKEKVDIKKELSESFKLSDLKVALSTYFEELKIGDAFIELFELNGNKKILDKYEFYLYFGEIIYEKTKYPVFYIPFHLTQSKNTFEIDFDAQIYTNKKAIEYVTQEYNKKNEKVAKIRSIGERIIYLANAQGTFPKTIENVFNDIVNSFALDGDFSMLSADKNISKGKFLSLNNNISIALFDRADEAVVNDYEGILKLLDLGNNPLQATFNKLINDFIHKDPESVANQVADEWDNQSAEDKLVLRSPIPLNSEQAQILSALKRDNCKYVTVQGPPGTGKSHTITAILFDAILNNKSTLVLSDKKEALDVVENKITQTLNEIRRDDNFQNPILRLGKTGNTYNQILANHSVDGIRTHYRALKKDYDNLVEETNKAINSLKEELQAESMICEDINIGNIQETIELEGKISKLNLPVNLEELKDNTDSATELEELRNIANKFSDLNKKKFKQLYAIDINTLSKNEKVSKDLAYILSIVKRVQTQVLDRNIFSTGIESFSLFTKLNSNDLPDLQTFVSEYNHLKWPLFGYLFYRKKVVELDKDFHKRFENFCSTKPSHKLDDFQSILDISKFCSDILKQEEVQSAPNLDTTCLLHKFLVKSDFVEQINKLQIDIDYYNDKCEKYPKTFRKAGGTKTINMVGKLFSQITDDDYNDLVRFLDLNQVLRNKFNHISFDHYLAKRSEIEQMMTLQMSYLMDGRFLNFYDKSTSTAKTLREIIRNKEKFPKNQFQKLKNAFPCILAGIRDYAEYIPLEAEIFDLVIIDEASQVSLAQAFPALIRAKKVLILGDKKQFSNVKAALARTDINKEYLHNLRQSFLKHVTDDPAKNKRLEKFNIKTSILEFFEFINNFNTQLKKHFRCYKEIISYSNEKFYNNSLQVTKIRGKSINDVIKFYEIKHDGKKELIPKSNSLEIDYIVSTLENLAKKNSGETVGIITPHTNQQKRLKESISKSLLHDKIYSDLNLGIWTFDTCQGEERDIIIYSMVANPMEDRLWGVFIKDLEKIDLEGDGKIRAQRLNVGFSRAKESVIFVISKPINEFSGSIGNALRHYQSTLEHGKKDPLPSSTDVKSPMEKKVLNWLTQTNFYNKNRDSINLSPQFEIGKYLKQINGSTYTESNYTVDFLLIFKKASSTHNIIIEYDGFKEHFMTDESVDKYNYAQYYKPEDKYREKVLEGYGYKFLRINKFNLGKNPIETLNERLEKLIQENTFQGDLLAKIHTSVDQLKNGDLHECPKCREVKERSLFKDTTLKSGYGRFCNKCKSETLHNKKVAPPEIVEGVICPICNSTMVKRSGRYGKFYGCSKFPYCKGTRHIENNSTT
jgi:very-short-patch-repair endonuclease